MILSTNFKPQNNYRLVKLIQKDYYSFEEPLRLRLIDLNNKDTFLLHCSQTQIAIWNKFRSHLEEMITLDNILQRTQV
jgi:hypothetical protein